MRNVPPPYRINYLFVLIQFFFFIFFLIIIIHSCILYKITSSYIMLVRLRLNYKSHFVSYKNNYVSPSFHLKMMALLKIIVHERNLFIFVLIAKS